MNRSIINNKQCVTEQKPTSVNPTNQNQQPQAIDYLLPKNETVKQSGLSIATIYRLIKAGKFPAPVAIGTGSVRWRQSDISAWLQSLPTTNQLK